MQRRLKDELYDAIQDYSNDLTSGTWKYPTSEGILEAIAPVIDARLDAIIAEIDNEARNYSDAKRIGMYRSTGIIEEHKIGPL